MTKSLTPKDFDFHLPEELIAKYPADKRDESRMMVLEKDTETITHNKFSDLKDYLREGDLLILNDTSVMPARLVGTKKTGGKVEVLLIRELQGSRYLVMIKGGKSLKEGDSVTFENASRSITVTLLKKGEGGFAEATLVSNGDLSEALQAIGHMPLPPYINREDEELDRTRYQTVFADSSKQKAVAAPTAGLHFTEEVLNGIKSKGVKVGFITLHTGPGTFLPVRVENIESHKVPAEWYSIPEEVYNEIVATKDAGHRVIAVGTTVTRTLEAAFQDGLNKDKLTGDTDIFIYPRSGSGYEFKVVDALLTNFHLPESSLIMLVAAFAGKDFIMKAYKEAVQEKYRFFSYGDCMLVR